MFALSIISVFSIAQKFQQRNEWLGDLRTIMTNLGPVRSLGIIELGVSHE